MFFLKTDPIPGNRLTNPLEFEIFEILLQIKRLIFSGNKGAHAIA